jgi:hypothetical protein
MAGSDSAPAHEATATVAAESENWRRCMFFSPECIKSVVWINELAAGHLRREARPG